MKKLFMALALCGAMLKQAADCGPYPFEFQSLCPTGVLVASCRDDGNWVFVGCWEF